MFEKRFNALYKSPRLACPAWLAITQSANGELQQQQQQPQSQTQTRQLARSTSSTTVSDAMCSTILNELSYLSSGGGSGARFLSTSSGASLLGNGNGNGNNGRNNQQRKKKTQQFIDTFLNTFVAGYNRHHQHHHHHHHHNQYDSATHTNNGSSNNSNANTRSHLFANGNVNGNDKGIDANAYAWSFSGSDPHRRFLTTMLTTLLKHHLTWVHTVLPDSSPPLGDPHASTVIFILFY